jgi:hypothetical protein
MGFSIHSITTLRGARHGHPPERVTVQFTRLWGIKRTLFFQTSILDHPYAGLGDREVMPGACDKTIVFPHAFAKRPAKSACFSSTLV